MYVILPGMCRPRGSRQLFLSSEEVDRICMFVASLCYSALVYSTSSQFTSSVSVVAPLNGSEGCGESRPEDSSTRHELQEGPSMVGRKQQAFFTTSPCRARIERVGCGGCDQNHSSEIGSETRGGRRSATRPPVRPLGRSVARPPASRPPSHCYTTFFSISRH